MINKITPEMKSSLSVNVRAYYDYQDERKRMDNRLGLTKEGKTKKKAPERDLILLTYLLNRREEVYNMEKELEREISKHISKEPLWTEFLKHEKGVGPMMAAVILTEIDIHKGDCVSKIWSFAGMAPGKDRKVKGKKCTYNAFLKAKMLGVLGSSFLKCKARYSRIYYELKQRLENSDNEVIENVKGGKKKTIKWRDATLKHRHDAANRRMVKEFLKDLYCAWRVIEGLPVRKPYAEEYLNKKHGDFKTNSEEKPKGKE